MATKKKAAKKAAPKKAAAKKAAPKKAAEHFRNFLQTITSAIFNDRDELLVDLIQHGLRVGALTLALGTERI